MIDNPFSMVAVIVICGTLISYFKYRRRTGEFKADPEAEKQMEALRREVFDLTQRVKTLEKIATDPEEKLKREFERL